MGKTQDSSLLLREFMGRCSTASVPKNGCFTHGVKLKTKKRSSQCRVQWVQSASDPRPKKKTLCPFNPFKLRELWGLPWETEGSSVGCWTHIKEDKTVLVLSYDFEWHTCQMRRLRGLVALTNCSSQPNKTGQASPHLAMSLSKMGQQDQREGSTVLAGLLSRPNAGGKACGGWQTQQHVQDASFYVYSRRLLLTASITPRCPSLGVCRWHFQYFQVKSWQMYKKPRPSLHV